MKIKKPRKKTVNPFKKLHKMYFGTGTVYNVHVNVKMLYSNSERIVRKNKVNLLS
jgi:hypothetical protein